MKVFISWSGERSKQMAKALDDWLPKVLQLVDPWMSETDISAGERWSVELSKQLEASEFGIICMTRDNLAAPWLLFEAGAISRSLSSGAVCPYLLDLDVRDISGPLGQFQAKKADKRSTLDLLNAINQRTRKPVPGLEDVFEAMWPRFDAELQAIPPSQESQTIATRSEAEILEELVTTVRGKRCWVQIFCSKVRRLARGVCGGWSTRLKSVSGKVVRSPMMGRRSPNFRKRPAKPTPQQKTDKWPGSSARNVAEKSSTSKAVRRRMTAGVASVMKKSPENAPNVRAPARSNEPTSAPWNVQNVTAPAGLPISERQLINLSLSLV
jgi:hypothetical protein